MPLTNAQAILLSNDAFLAGFNENEPKLIQLAQVLPFYPIFGDSETVPRITAANLGAAAIFDAGATAVSDTPAVPTSPNVAFSLKLIISSFKNNYTAQYDMSNVNDQSSIQILAAVRRMLYAFWTKFYLGDQTANPQEFDGLRILITAGQTVTANAGAGGQPTLLEFDRMLGLLKSDPSVPTYMVVNQGGLRAWRQAWYAAGIAPPMIPVTIPYGDGTRTVMAPSQDGRTPIIIDDSITNDEPAANYTSAYALALGKDGLHGIIPEGTQNTMFSASTSMVDGKAQDVTVIRWPVGLVLRKQTYGVRLNKITPL